MSDRFMGGGMARTAKAVAARCELTKEARALLGTGVMPWAFIERLLERELYGDAICFLAQALPKRLAVWWGCECVWHLARPDPPEDVTAALQAAIQWVLDPTEANRRAAPADDRKTPAGCLALAAFWSGGSMTPPTLPLVSPPPDLTGRVVGGAILLAAVQRDAPRFREHYREFLALGLELARAQPFWTAGTSLPETDAGVIAPAADEETKVSSVEVESPVAAG
jgi:hypothetical protein